MTWDSYGKFGGDEPSIVLRTQILKNRPYGYGSNSEVHYIELIHFKFWIYHYNSAVFNE